MDPALQELLAEGGPDDEVAVVLRLADGPLPAAVRIVARFGPIATCRLQRGAIPHVRAEAGVLSMKAPHVYSAEPDASVDSVDDDAAEAEDLAPRDSDHRRPDQLVETGRGVLVAHIDWGADIAHPDFRNADGSTRFAALWDQGAPYDAQNPNRYGYGRIHNAANINRALESDDPYAALGYHPARGKAAGGSHGSHTLGISAGNGRAGGPLGLAPEAVLAFVDLSTQRQPTDAGLGDSAALLEGLHFIAELAESLGAAGTPLPLVVNASLGRQAGQHDGKTLTEQGMDAFLEAAPGRAIVQSTGNYFGRHIHAAGLLRPGAEAVLKFSIAVMHPPHEIDLWYPGPDDIAIQVLGPAGMAPVRAVAGTVTLLEYSGRQVGRVYHRRGDPNNGDHQLALYLDAVAPAGAWALSLHGEDVVDGRFHAWIERGPGGGAVQARFAPDHDSPCCTLGTICNGLRTLAVGGVDAHRPNRPLTPFSSGGPTRDGRGKPDLVAPGLRVLSARSAGADGIARPLLMRMSGTSMAAPHVSGTVALMFAASPRPLAIHETRRLLLAGTTPAAPAADAVSHWRLGAGHLDTLAAVDAVRETAVAPSFAATEHTLSATDTLSPGSAAMPTTPVEVETFEAPETAPAEAGAEPGQAKVKRRAAFASPLQFQIPVGGGAPSLAVPIGGKGSPLALSAPLGGAPAPTAAAPAPVAAQTAGAPPAPAPGSVPTASPLPGEPAVPAPADNPLQTEPVPPSLASVPATGFDAPVTVAGTVDMPGPNPEADETATGWAFDSPPTRAPNAGLSLLTAAEAACSPDHQRAPRSSSQWLRHLLGHRDGPGQGRAFSPCGDGVAMPTATALFNAFVFTDRHPVRRRLKERYLQSLRPLVGPGDRIGGLRVLPGDLLLRVALGQGYGQAAVVASPIVCREDELPAWTWQVPGRGQPREGHYLHVVEVLPRVRGLGERWARRVADASGRLLPDTLLLRRLLASEDSPPITEDHLGALAEDATADIRWLQNALNQVLGTHLVVDGDAGPATRSAVRTFQGRSGLAADGIAGSRTLAALRDALQRVGGGSPVPATPTHRGGAQADEGPRDLRQRIVNCALTEFERWGRGTKLETSEEMGPVLRDYWFTGTGRRVNLADLRSSAWQNLPENPWSAAFISWVMRCAGAGDSFAYGRAHAIYIASAKQARIAGDARRFQAYAIDEAGPEIGDLVCKDRKTCAERNAAGNCILYRCSGTTYANVARGRNSHSDIVVELDSARRRIRVIGGNVGGSVGEKWITLDESGHLPARASDGCAYIAVLKPPAAAVSQGQSREDVVMTGSE